MKTLNKKKPSMLLKTLLLPLVLIMLTIPALAGGIADSQLGKGLMAMANDLTPWLVGLSAALGVVFALIFNIRKGMADEEQEEHIWKKRIRNAIVCGVSGALIGSIMSLGLSYFQ